MISEHTEISIIVPCYNESEVLNAFYERTQAVINAFTANYEIIFVNDGSVDNTLEVILSLHKNDTRVKLIDLSRNFGKEIAMTAGIDFAVGEAVVIIDADLQDPPELIPEMVKFWQQGNDVVYATRTSRKGETLTKKLTASLFYKIIGSLSKVKIPENTGDYRLMSRRTIDALKLLRERHRFMKGLFSWIGFKQVSIPYYREPRAAGTTKWSYWKLWNFAIEGITSFSYGPLQISSYFGAGVAILAVLYALFLIVRVSIYGIDVPGYASIMVTVLFIGAVQLITLGVIGEYLGRMFNETKYRPLYLVQAVAGIIPATACMESDFSESRYMCPTDISKGQ